MIGFLLFLTIVQSNFLIASSNGLEVINPDVDVEAAKTLMENKLLSSEIFLKTPAIVIDKSVLPKAFFLQFEGPTRIAYDCLKIVAQDYNKQNFLDSLKQGAKKNFSQFPCNLKLVFRRPASLPFKVMNEIALGGHYQPKNLDCSESKIFFASLGSCELNPGKYYFFDGNIKFNTTHLNQPIMMVGARMYHSFFGGWVRTAARFHTDLRMLQSDTSHQADAEKIYSFLGFGLEFRFLRWVIAELSLCDLKIDHQTLKQKLLESGFLKNVKKIKEFMPQLNLKWRFRVQPCRPTHWLFAPAFLSTKSALAFMRYAPSEHSSYLNLTAIPTQSVQNSAENE